MSGTFWARQNRPTASASERLSRGRYLTLTILPILGIGTLSLLAAFAPNLYQYINMRIVANVAIVAFLASGILLFVRYSVSALRFKLYLPVTYALTGIAIAAYFALPRFVELPEIQLYFYRLWSMYALHTIFAILFTIAVYTESVPDMKDERVHVPWFIAFGTLLFVAACGMMLWAGSHPSFIVGFLKRTEEIVPLFFSVTSAVVILRGRKWQTHRTAFALLVIALLLFVGSIHILFASNYAHPLEIIGYGYIFVAAAVPFFTILRSMMHAYLIAEQYRAKEQNAMRNLSLQGGQSLSPVIFREIAQQLNEAFAITDVTGRIVFVNQHLVRMSGFDEQRLINNTPAIWQHETVPRDFYAQIFSKIRSDKKMFEGIVHNSYPANRQKGYNAELRITPVLNEFGEIAVCVLQQRSLTDEQEQLKLMRQVLDTMPLGVMLFEPPSLKVRLGNQQAEVLLSRAGYDFRAVANFQDIVSRFKKKDGTPYPIDDLPPLKTLKTQKRSEVSDIALFLGADTTPSMIWKMTAIPFFHEDGTMRAILIDFDDVTKHLEYEHKMTDFISVASHQLRTPLTSIKWSLDALRKPNNGLQEEDKLSLFDTCYKAAERMMATIQQLLKVAELEREDVVIESRAIDFTAIIKETLAALKPSLEAKKMNFKETVLHSVPMIQFSPFYLNQITHNLIENAIKYTPEGGQIDSILNVVGDRIEWTLHDSGIGITKKDLERVFEKFYRSDSAQRMVPDGTGLGLYIVKRTLDLCGGTIRVESEEGRGTTMIVNLPLVQKNATPTPNSTLPGQTPAPVIPAAAPVAPAVPAPAPAAVPAPAPAPVTTPIPALVVMPNPVPPVIGSSITTPVPNTPLTANPATSNPQPVPPPSPESLPPTPPVVPPPQP